MAILIILVALIFCLKKRSTEQPHHKKEKKKHPEDKATSPKQLLVANRVNPLKIIVAQGKSRSFMFGNERSINIKMRIKNEGSRLMEMVGEEEDDDQ